MTRSFRLLLSLAAVAAFTGAGCAAGPETDRAEPSVERPPSPRAERVRVWDTAALRTADEEARPAERRLTHRQIHDRLAGWIDGGGAVDDLIATIERELGPIRYVDAAQTNLPYFLTDEQRETTCHIYFTVGNTRYTLAILIDAHGNYIGQSRGVPFGGLWTMPTPLEATWSLNRAVDLTAYTGSVAGHPPTSVADRMRTQRDPSRPLDDEHSEETDVDTDADDRRSALAVEPGRYEIPGWLAARIEDGDTIDNIAAKIARDLGPVHYVDITPMQALPRSDLGRLDERFTGWQPHHGHIWFTYDDHRYLLMLWVNEIGTQLPPSQPDGLNTWHLAEGSLR